MPTRVRSHAKINLGLGIGAPRADGFHALATVYQTLELHDLVTVTARPAAATAIRITSSDARVPTDERNTAWKIVSRALAGFQIAAAVDIHIEKRLPVQGGLGAGSANAVAALIGLENETAPWVPDRATSLADVFATRGTMAISETSEMKPLGTGERVRRGLRGLPMLIAERDWAEQVGSDVPLFLIGGTILGLDRGQEVYPLPDLEPVWCVVALPEIGVSTPQAFRDWDTLCAAEGLTQEASADKLKKLSRAYASAFAGMPKTGSSGVVPRNQFEGSDLAGLPESALVRTGITSWIENDFERVVFAQQPSLREIKRILLGQGTPEVALYASLSGSGSALFGLYLTRGDAEAACGRLESAGVRSQITRTLPRADYWREMLA